MENNVRKWTLEGFDAATIAHRLKTTKGAVTSRRVKIGVKMPQQYISEPLKMAMKARENARAYSGYI